MWYGHAIPQNPIYEFSVWLSDHSTSIKSHYLHFVLLTNKFADRRNHISHIVMLKGVLVTLYPPTINFHFDVGFHNNQNIKLWEAKVQIILLTHKFFVKKNIHFLRFISPQLCPLSITFKFSETDADCWQILATQP